MPGKTESKLSFEDQLIHDMGELSGDPLSWVYYSFKWGEGELAEHDGPDEWQAEILAKIRDGLLDINQAIQVAVASGHGVGKSALVAWIILWSLSTFEDTKGVVTANTETQLKTKTWSELAKWYRLFIAKDWFTFTATAIFSVDKEHEKTWRFDMVAWSEHKTEAFAGMHNQGKRVVVIFDEASAISDKIWEVTEGALTDKNTQKLWITFGNPTRGEGKFFECFHKMRHRWVTLQVDSRKAKMTDKVQINKWIEDYGEDSDFVRVRVRGVFPNISDRQFIPSSYVEAARKRTIPALQFSFAAKIMTVEPAWTGGDEFVIGLRQGNSFRILNKYAKNDDDFVMAGYISNYENIEQADAVFVDFGYGTGIVSAGRQLGKNWILIPFGSASTDPAYVNKRAQMWGDMKQWLKDGGQIPDEPILCAQLTGVEYEVVATGKNAGKILLESKKDMKARGLESPDRGDSCALSFALPVAPKPKTIIPGQSNLEFANSGQKYNPLKGATVGSR